MDVDVLVAIVTGSFAFLGVVVTVVIGNKKTADRIKQQTDLTIYRLEQLEKKQDKHNSLIERTYRLEEENTLKEEQIKVVNHRLKNIEQQLNGK